tara:strand:+ start:748 stop:933 length:186 start_codon:yes stop_codon:yes gene_type:complete
VKQIQKINEENLAVRFIIIPIFAINIKDAIINSDVLFWGYIPSINGNKTNGLIIFSEIKSL